VAATVSLAFIAVALLVGVSLAADWLTPYRNVVKVTKPISSRIHFGSDADPSAAPQAQAPSTREAVAQKAATAPATP
jgi:hypothetical protein